MADISGKIEFLDYHIPALPSGEYEISLTQELDGKEYSPQGQELPGGFSLSTTKTQKFRVLGDPYNLKHDDLYAVFPPEGSLGDHANVLPHLILNRSTHPWEFHADDDDETTPWLVLLVFHEGELGAEAFKTIPLSELDSGETEGQVKVLDVPKDLLGQLAPAKADLALLTHVRQRLDEDGGLSGQELAMIIANRLPAASGVTEVHLVSVNGKYVAGGWPANLGASDPVRLVSLKNWRFACVDPEQSFKRLVLNLDSSNLRMPAVDGSAESYLEHGNVPLIHQMRGGDQVISWYHGPLGAGAQTAAFNLPAKSADELYIYNPNNRFFDVSYAAAWELGRLLALKSKDLSINLYQWKRTHKRQQLILEQALLHPHIAGQQQQAPAVLPDKIRNWFDNLRLLKGIPFNYLVPDERMLPKESIRFFKVDHEWIDCLLDGAFSIGRVISGDYEHDRQMINHVRGETPENITGFLLRSDLVKGWPALLLEAYAEAIPDGTTHPTQTPLNVLRREQLSENVLLCLFEGEFQTLDFHQKPEALHFGVDINGAAYTKDVFYVDEQGKQIPDPASDKKITIQLDAGLWKSRDQLVLNVSSLSDNLKSSLKTAGARISSFTSAQFAMAMIEGVEKVRFKRTN